MRPSKLKSKYKPIKTGVLVILCYLFLAVSFYFLAGEQLHIRQSRGNIEMPIAESVSAEMVSGSVVEQIFTPEIQSFESISILWGNYNRPNFGTAVVEVYNTLDNTLLGSQTIDVSTIQDGMTTELRFENPIETVYNVPLKIRITSDSVPGSAITPLMSLSEKNVGQVLLINGNEVEGTLCFSANGIDYIWTGLHYWDFVLVGLACLILILLVIWYRAKKGKHSYIVNAVVAMRKYRFLIHQLVSRDFKTKYKRSVLGILWSFLNPLLTMCVQYFIFSTVFQSDIDNYPVYLLIGIVAFNFFSEACGMSLTSILGNASLITKVYVPKYIYPLTRTMSSSINLAISLIPLILVALFTGVTFEKSAVLSVYFFLCLIVFSFGLGLLLSASMVFFRDTQFLWGVLSMLWMYATPIFYPESILPKEFIGALKINPLYHFIQNIRLCILNGISPEPFAYFQCFLIAIGMLLVGALIFYKTQDKFVLYI